ncbi:hypothetical protein [Klebsiella oxytoca]|uniref:hypothetical protein n=1 Tax=Klebsiella oxytoca TaxID=571 RepID=UPI002245EE9F|nr:hypothetical protein [Klebsiella oxytoca]MCW9635570.1 hypothetical protein [Klebsiella oxytoca]
MNIETVNELIQSLESAGELSIREQKFLKQSERELDKTCAEEFGPDWVSELTETPATDAYLAGIKADGVEEWVSSRGGRWNGTTEEALKFAKHLREGKSEEVKS